MSAEPKQKPLEGGPVWNVRLNVLSMDLSQIVQNRDPDGPIVGNAVWGRLEKFALEVREEARAADQAKIAALAEAAQEVLDGLHARIHAASAEGKAVPVFNGIAALTFALASTQAGAE